MPAESVGLSHMNCVDLSPMVDSLSERDHITGELSFGMKFSGVWHIVL